MSAKPKYASFATEDLKEGTGLFDDVNGKITNIQYTKEAPDNYEASGNPIFSVLNLLLDGDAPEDERKVSQTYSLGAQAGDHFAIAPDGYGLIANDDTVQASGSSKWGKFVKCLETAGVPKPILQAGDFSALIGLHGHFKRTPDEVRTFSDDQRTKPGQQRKSKFPPSTLVLTKLIAMPGQVGTVATKPVANAAVTTTAVVSELTADDLDGSALTFLTAALKKAKDGVLQRNQILLAVSKQAMALGNRAEIAKRATEEAFLKELVDAGLVNYDPAAKPQVVSLAA